MRFKIKANDDFYQTYEKADFEPLAEAFLNLENYGIELGAASPYYLVCVFPIEPNRAFLEERWADMQEEYAEGDETLAEDSVVEAKFKQVFGITKEEVRFIHVFSKLDSYLVKSLVRGSVKFDSSEYFGFSVSDDGSHYNDSDLYGSPKLFSPVKAFLARD